MNTKNIIKALELEYLKKGAITKERENCKDEEQCERLNEEYTESKNRVALLEKELKRSLKTYSLTMVNNTSILLHLTDNEQVKFTKALYDGEARFVELVSVYKDNERIEDRVHIINLNNVIEIR